MSIMFPTEFRSTDVDMLIPKTPSPLKLGIEIKAVVIC
jgi:hypothetical protein